jgi:hypothetical protein
MFGEPEVVCSINEPCLVYVHERGVYDCLKKNILTNVDASCSSRTKNKYVAVFKFCTCHIENRNKRLRWT